MPEIYMLGISTSLQMAQLLQELARLNVDHVALLTRSRSDAKRRNFLLLIAGVKNPSSTFPANSLAVTYAKLLAVELGNSPRFNFTVNMIETPNLYNMSAIKVKLLEHDSLKIKQLIETVFRGYLFYSNIDDHAMSFEFAVDVSYGSRGVIAEALEWMYYPDSDQRIKIENQHDFIPLQIFAAPMIKRDRIQMVSG
jgi:hypothetical protein